MQLKVPFAETSIGDRAISSEAMLVKATAGPLPWSLALEALQRQSQCWLPLKLALAEHGAPQILAEAPRLRSRRESEARAAEILDAALAWLGGKSAPDASWGGSEATGALEDTLACLPFAWSPAADGGFRVDAMCAGSPLRLTITSLGCGSIRIFTAGAVRCTSRAVGHAISVFALEANRRLRFARLGVGASQKRAVQVVWDAIAPADLPIDRVLPNLVDAVIEAHARTSRPLVALSHPTVARAYLEAQKLAPPRRSTLARGAGTSHPTTTEKEKK